jgi:hypothetical protein
MKNTLRIIMLLAVFGQSLASFSGPGVPIPPIPIPQTSIAA